MINNSGGRRQGATRAARAVMRAQAASFLELLGPALPARPACAGMHPLFDGQADRESNAAAAARHAKAAAVCAGCPALAGCAELLPTLPSAAGGVWAGHVVAGARTRSLLPGAER